MNVDCFGETTPANLSAWQGAGTVDFDVAALGAAGTASSCASLTSFFAGTASMSISVNYFYCVLPPPPGIIYCVGDPGVGTPCPCGDNDGSVPGSGCDNGVFASGAQLTGSGMASVSADSLLLTTTHLEPTNSGLYFQGNNAVNGGNGNPFGDGLRCAGGGLVRLQVRTSNAAGTSSTTIPLGVKGGVVAGDTKRYQCWYRTTVSPPCGLGVNDFNLSNGYEITWAP